MRLQVPKPAEDKPAINVEVPLPRRGSSDQDKAAAMEDADPSNCAEDDDRDDMYELP